jgi:superfamily I DNA/RNA helicase
MNTEELKKQEAERDRLTKAIVVSLEPKKIIVSGPGTGKTFLFGQIINQKPGSYLVLTFINNLADKLKQELGNKAKCCTFHSFCKSILHKVGRKGINDKFILYPQLNLIVKSDALLLFGKELHFRQSFTQLKRKSPELEFFIERSNYYNAISFDDSVFRVIEHFEQNPTDIPTFDQVLVDEYQDFNLLEVTFIDLISQKNAILIVGDDDQALYGQLKDASPQYIREKYRSKEYKNFELPFCSRCTTVIVDAIQDILTRATAYKKLQSRINKTYICYLPKKLEDNKKYPTIIHAHCSVQSERVPYLSKFIEKEIKSLDQKEIEEANSEADSTVLITGPHHYLKQINSYLTKYHQEWQIVYNKQDDMSKRTNILDGYRMFVNNDKVSNLGWRIILEHEGVKNLKDILKESFENKKAIYDYIPKDIVSKHEVIVNLLENVKNGVGVSGEEKKLLESMFKQNSVKLQEYLLERGENAKEAKDKRCISVILSTYVGCKGLSAGYVFAVGLNEGNLPKNNRNPTDIEVCQFIVILTRTVKKCYLTSVGRFAGAPAGFPSIFFQWIGKKHLKEELIDKNYKF